MTPHPSPSPKTGWHLSGWVLALMLIGLLLRLYNLGEKSLWSDEICTIASALGNSVDPNALPNFDPTTPHPASHYQDKAITSHGFLALGAIVEVLKQNIHPPFFFSLMNLSIHILGMDPFSLRLLPVLLGVGCIPMIFLLGRQLGGPMTGLIAAGLYTFSGYQIAHAQDARQYTLITLLAVSSAWLMWRLFKQAQDGKEREAVGWEWRVLTLLSIIGLYTQYFYGIYYLFLMTYATWRTWNNRIFRFHLLLSAALTGLLFSPWLLIFREQWAFMKAEGHYTSGLWKPLQVPEILWRTLADFTAPQETLLKITLPLLLLGAGLLYWRWVRHQGRTFYQAFIRPLRNGALGFLLLWIVFLFGTQIVLDLLKDSHTLSIRRYTLLNAPAFYLLVGYALATLQIKPPRIKNTVVALCCAGLLALQLQNSMAVLEGRKLRSDDFRQAAQWINPKYQPRDVVLVHKTGAIAVGLAYYLDPQIPMLGLPIGKAADLQEQPHLSQRIHHATTQADRVWLVFSHSGQPIQQNVITTVEEAGFQRQDEQIFPGVRVVELIRTPKTPRVSLGRIDI